jgi:DnaJ-class molecular chaperone
MLTFDQCNIKEDASQAILGGKVDVPTIGGQVRVTFPKGASTGQTLRLRKKGEKSSVAGRPGSRLARSNDPGQLSQSQLLFFDQRAPITVVPMR